MVVDNGRHCLLGNERQGTAQTVRLDYLGGTSDLTTVLHTLHEPSHRILLPRTYDGLTLLKSPVNTVISNLTFYLQQQQM